MRMSSRTRVIAIMSTLALTGVLLTACGHAKKTPAEQVAAQAYLTALGSGDSTAAAEHTSSATAAATAIMASLAGLGSGTKATLTVTGLTGRTKTAATADYTASWTLPGVSKPWTYTGTLPMVKQGDVWQVSWTAADIAPKLTAGKHLSVVRTQPTRAALEDAAGSALFSPTPVVDVGINPGLVTDLPTLAAALAAVPQLQTTVAEVTAAVKAAPKNQFLPIITLRKTVYEQIKPKIYSLPGTAFTTSTLLLPPTSTFAKPLLGSVGDATAEIVAASKGRVVAGDQTGLSGLQLALDPQLAGTAGASVYATATDGTLGAKLATVTAPVTGKPVKLTLNTAMQKAADQVLGAVTLPAALVAIQPSTGKVLAVANSAAADDDIALAGQYPAGSTFKIATYTAAFENDPTLTASSPTTCPATVTVDGRVFENENQFSHGTIPLSSAFGYSCNTTAIATGDALPTGALAKAAAQLGLGAKWNLPVDAFSGSIPAAGTGTEKAAEAIGQGKVLVSPLLMAEIAGASATGTPVAPSLVVGQQATPGAKLSADVTAKMNTLLRATVALPGATGYADLNALPGEIRGKTGTAEFGTDVPPKSHSWFAGSRGDLAIAVFVYGGEQSTTGAVPLARDFFAAVP